MQDAEPLIKPASSSSALTRSAAASKAGRAQEISPNTSESSSTVSTLHLRVFSQTHQTQLNLLNNFHRQSHVIALPPSILFVPQVKYLCICVAVVLGGLCVAVGLGIVLKPGWSTSSELFIRQLFEFSLVPCQHARDVQETDSACRGMEK